MSRYLLDLHIHSKYARATSTEADLENYELWARYKGLDIIGTGDFTHPMWFKELKDKLIETEPGLFKLKSVAEISPVRFMLTTEVACIYSQGGKVRRLHLCIFAPSLAAVEKLNKALTDRGINIKADGRPILGMSGHDLLALISELDEGFEMVPAHAWTPWFAVFGSKSGFDSLQECFGDLTSKINAIETGLSSDPAMNWRLSALDNIMLVSNSDAHSPSKLGREANAFELSKLSYQEIISVLRNKDRQKFLFTIEFFPEEGMYHWDGHRACNVSCDPEQTKRWNGICPQCKRPLTIGVMNRVDNLADRKNGFKPPQAVPFHSLVPLVQIISDAYDMGVSSKNVLSKYFSIVKKFSELPLLLDKGESNLSEIKDVLIIEGIKRMQNGQVNIKAGYDGVYGEVHIFTEKDRKRLAQQSLF